MKIPITVQLVILTVGLTAFYTMVGQAVPQKESHPPEVIEIAKDVSPEEMAEIGKGIFEGKGICVTCHTITGKSGALRFPDLQGIASRVGSREPGMGPLDYFTKSLYEPDAFIVDGFSKGMPAINKPPIGLTDDEILTVIAYLQTLGGEVTVTMETQHAYNGGTLMSEGGGEVVMADAGDAGADTGVADTGTMDSGPLAAYGCTKCHYTDRAGNLQGPSLFDVGTRLSRDQLVAGLVYHQGEDGLDQVTQADLQSLIAVMTQLKGQG